jgi:aspartyl-tRNA(Asn)/glutamyl-tRNA(Gln) amidotransferase subunit B
VGSDSLGVKTEIKNLNSFRVVKMAIEYEIVRQAKIIESGASVQQVTMGWSERENRTVVQRSKEYAEDYRYFPEPDLPPLQLDSEYVADARGGLPELPQTKRDRFVAEYAIRPQDAVVLAADARVSDYFDASVHAAAVHGVEARTVCNWLLGELFRLSNETGIPIAESAVPPQALADLLDQVKRKVITANTGKEVLAEMFRTGKPASTIIAERGLAQIRDADRITDFVAQAVGDNPEPVSQYFAGKENVFGFLIGQVMQASQGKADPQLVRRLLREYLEALRDA